MATHWKPRSVFASDAGHLADLGATMHRPGQFTLDVSRDCSNPRHVEVSYTDQHRSKFRTWRGNVEYTVACRQCPNCLSRRRRHWQARIVKELRQADRSWFGTLTVEPEKQHLAMLRAERDSLRRGVPWRELNEQQRFVAVVKAIAPELTLWIKRVRKNSGAHIRYCLVAESHKSGLPHFHVVIHHRVVPVRYKTLREAWSLGFSDFKLVDENHNVARYLAKYLAKALGSRVRASARYGKNNVLEHSGKPRVKTSPPQTQQLDNASAETLYVAGAMCPSCGTALERLDGHYDKAYRERVSASEWEQDERLSNESAIYAAARSPVTPWAGDRNDASQPAVALYETGQGSQTVCASGESSPQPSAGQPDCAEGANRSQTEPVSEGGHRPEIWACPKGCIRDAPLSIWEPMGHRAQGSAAAADVQPGKPDNSYAAKRLVVVPRPG